MRAERAAWIVAHAHPQHVRPDRKPLVMDIAPDPVEARVPIIQIAHVRSLKGPSIQFEHEHQIAVIEGDHMLIDMPRIRQEFLGHFLPRSEEHTSELQSLMRISYAVFCLKKKTKKKLKHTTVQSNTQTNNNTP